MKIITPGKEIHKKRLFTCCHCGCQFIADKTEYHTTPMLNDFYYSMECPNCFEYISDSEEIME